MAAHEPQRPARASVEVSGCFACRAARLHGDGAASGPGSPVGANLRPQLLFAIFALLGWTAPATGQTPSVLSGFVVHQVTTLPAPTLGIAVAPASFGAYQGDIFIANHDAQQVIRVTPAGATHVFASGIFTVTNLSFAPGGAFGTDLYVSANQDASALDYGALWRVGPSGTPTYFGTQTPPSPLNYRFGAGGIAFSLSSPFGTYLYSGVSGGSLGDAISRIGPAGGQASLFNLLTGSGGGLSFGTPVGIQFGPGAAGFGTDLYFAYYRTPGSPGLPEGVYRLAPDGTRTSFSPVPRPGELEFGPGGAFGADLYVVDRGGSILRIDSAGNATTFISGIPGGAFGLAFADTAALYFNTVNDAGVGRLFRVTREDLGPPVVTAPADASYQCLSQVPAAAPEQATATDDQGVASLTVSEASNGGAGSPASPLVLTRTWTATDPAGNSASDAQTISVVDDTAPMLTLPAAISTSTGPGTEPCATLRITVETGSASATDNCGEPTVTVSGLPEGGLFPVGETQLTWTATDAAGNSASGVQSVTVTCPVGDLVGSASLLCNGQSEPAQGVTVSLLHEGSPFLSTTTGPTGEWRLDDLRQGTYTVSIEAPTGYAVAPSTQLVTLDQAEETADPFLFTCLLSDLTGQVLGICSGQTSGLQGVTVDVYGEDSGGMDVLVATTATDAAGGFRFDDLPLGDYTVGLVLPLGYTTGSSSREVTLATPDGSVTAESFTLTCQVMAAQPRSMGYWKHQVNFYLTGKGSAQETLAQLLGYLDLMVVHFNQHVVNPVVVYVPGASSNDDKLLQLQQLLTVNRDGTMLDRAKQQLLALLLNVVSGKISQVEEISDNAATVSQAITHSYDLIVDGDPSTDETAKTICDLINSGQRVPPGMVPAGVPAYTYDPEPVPQRSIPLALGLGPIAPNPATLAGTIAFALPTDTRAVLEVVDLAGRMVHREEVGSRGAGYHTVRLAELRRMPPGIYLVRLTQGRESLIKRLAVIR